MLCLFIFAVIIILNAEAADLSTTATHPTILVNNAELAVGFINRLKNIDFMAAYPYVDGEVVKVTCINFFNESPLTMQYAMAGVMSDKSTMDDLSSNKTIGFVTKLHSGHNNSFVICTRTEGDDYTKLVLTFVMKTTRNYKIVFLEINGMAAQTQIYCPRDNRYTLKYMYNNNQAINLTCEVKQSDVNLLVLDHEFVGKLSRYQKTDLIPNKKSEMRFILNREVKETECSTKYLNGTRVGSVAVQFIARDFPVEQYPLHMALPSNGRVMELYNDYKLNVIYYEFEDGETLQLTCGPLRVPSPGPVVYLELGSEKCENLGCFVSKTLHVTGKDKNTKIACYLKEKRDPTDPVQYDFVRREIRVILRERLPTSITYTSTTITPTTTTLSTATTNITTSHTAANPASSETPTNVTFSYSLSAVGVVLIALISVGVYLTMKKQWCVRPSAPIPAPRPDPATVYYENLLAVFRPINEREAAVMEENHYEEID